MEATHAITNIEIGTMGIDGISFTPINDGYINDKLQFPDFGACSHSFTINLTKAEYYKWHYAIYGSLPKLPRKLKKKVKK